MRAKVKEGLSNTGLSTGRIGSRFGQNVVEIERVQRYNRESIEPNLKGIFFEFESADIEGVQFAFVCSKRFEHSNNGRDVFRFERIEGDVETTTKKRGISQKRAEDKFGAFSVKRTIRDVQINQIFGAGECEAEMLSRAGIENISGKIQLLEKLQPRERRDQGYERG